MEQIWKFLLSCDPEHIKATSLRIQFFIFDNRVLVDKFWSNKQYNTFKVESLVFFLEKLINLQFHL